MKLKCITKKSQRREKMKIRLIIRKQNGFPKLVQKKNKKPSQLKQMRVLNKLSSKEKVLKLKNMAIIRTTWKAENPSNTFHKQN